MATFVLLLRGGDFSKYSPEELKNFVHDYYSWGEMLRNQRKNKDCELHSPSPPGRGTPREARLGEGRRESSWFLAGPHPGGFS